MPCSGVPPEFPPDGSALCVPSRFTVMPVSVFPTHQLPFGPTYGVFPSVPLLPSAPSFPLRPSLPSVPFCPFFPSAPSFPMTYPRSTVSPFVRMMTSFPSRVSSIFSIPVPSAPFSPCLPISESSHSSSLPSKPRSHAISYALFPLSPLFPMRDASQSASVPENPFPSAI